MVHLFLARAFWCTRNLIKVPRPLPAAALAVYRKYLAVVPRPLPAVVLVVRRK
jgi:hypothetical protein